MHPYLLAERLLNISAKPIQSHQDQHSDAHRCDVHWVGHDRVANGRTMVQEIHVRFGPITAVILHLLDRVHE